VVASVHFVPAFHSEIPAKNEKYTLELLLSITMDQGAHKAVCHNDRHICQLILHYASSDLIPIYFLVHPHSIPNFMVQCLQNFITRKPRISSF
jgi:hypothetical protein